MRECEGRSDRSCEGICSLRIPARPEPFKLVRDELRGATFRRAALELLLHVGKAYLDVREDRLIETGKQFCDRDAENRLIRKCCHERREGDRPFVEGNLMVRDESDEFGEFALVHARLQPMRPKIAGQWWRGHVELSKISSCFDVCLKRNREIIPVEMREFAPDDQQIRAAWGYPQRLGSVVRRCMDWGRGNCGRGVESVWNSEPGIASPSKPCGGMDMVREMAFRDIKEGRGIQPDREITYSD